jgi:SagB-type dehydrogenase family enzyme
MVFILDVPVFCEVQKRPRADGLKVVQLPAPSLSGLVTLEEAISVRRSVRQFADKPLNFVQIGQLAWAGQGITDKQHGLRAAPSAWAVYPIELYFVTSEGLFVYQPDEHSLEQIVSTDLRSQLSLAVKQESLAEAACDIVIAGSVRKLAPKFGNRAEKFLFLEAGHVSENIQLQAVALKLASVPVGDFDAKSVDKICGLAGDLEPLLIVAVGYPREPGAGSESGAAAGNKKVLLVVPAANFRDEELFETQRVLNEAGIASVVASSKIGPLQGMLGGLVASEVVLDKVQVEDYDAVVFIGGSGAAEFFADPAALDIARRAAAGRKVIAAISVAPAILANAGVLKGVRATGFINQREMIRKGGAKYTGAAIERDGLIITASDPSVVVPFARMVASVIEERQPKPVKKK